MGFSIFACVIAGVMFICYAVTLADYSKLKHCQRKYFGGDYPSYFYRSYDYCYNRYNMNRETAANVAGLGSCLLIFSIVEFFLALVSSIYCCAGVCCNTPSAAVRSVSCDTQQFSCQCFHIQGKHRERRGDCSRLEWFFLFYDTGRAAKQYLHVFYDNWVNSCALIGQELWLMRVFPMKMA